MSESDAHIQDSQILAMSKQEANDAGNKIRFICTLPSGRQVATGFFDPGKKREMMQKWLEGVRAELVRDEEETRIAARRKAQESALPESPTDVPSADSLQQTHGSTTPSVSTTAAIPAARPSVSASPAHSPDQYVKEQYVQAAAAVAHWAQQSMVAQAELVAAELALERWRKIGQSIGVVTSEEDAAGGNAGVEPDGVQPAGSES